MKRIVCLFHKEDTPSMVLYPNGTYHCFGCAAHGKTKDLKGITYEEVEDTPRYVEDVKASVAKILRLPIKIIRGIPLHYDEGGYYVLWPDHSYYKYRRLGQCTNSNKYRCPTGVAKPVFYLRSEQESKTAIITEGEVNALSLWEACKDFDVICPGGASDFYSKGVQKWLPILQYCSKILLMVDKDKAGTIAAIKLKSALLQITHDIPVVLMSKDANDVLQQEGKEALKTLVYENLGLRKGLQSKPQGL
jgi:hypothetical protein